MTVQARIDRMFNSSGRCFNVAIDHGMVNEPAMLEGIEDMPSTVRTCAQAGPDVIQLTPGMARLLQGLQGRGRPALAMRADVSNVYGPTLPSTPFAQLTTNPVEQALVADACCVVVNLMQLPGAPDLHRQCVDNVLTVREQCQRYGMPLMVEPLVIAPNERGGYMVDGDVVAITTLVRQAAELGADIIKADPCSDPAEFHRVVRAGAGAPVLVRGGGRESDEVILHRTEQILRQGAHGIVYGRNIIQHPDPAAMVEALMGIVHGSMDAVQAHELLVRRTEVAQEVA